MHRHDRQILASMVLLSVFFLFAVCASHSGTFNPRLRRTLQQTMPDSAAEVAAEYIRLTDAQEAKRTSETPQELTAVVEQPEETKQPDGEEEPAALQQEEVVEAQAAPQDTTTPAAAVSELSKEEMEVNAHITKLHSDMCSAEWANADPLPYDSCDPNAPVNAVSLFGGLTNALKMILLGGVKSWEENRCFFVDESVSHLNKPDQHGVRHGFLHKYMEPIGLDLDHPIVKKAREENRIVKRDWSEFWNDLSARRAYGHISKLPSLGFQEIEGHNLKRNLIRRMWRPHNKYRQASCHAMEETHGLKPAEYMAFSVRRGDKGEEKFAFTELSEYIDEAEKQLHRFQSYSTTGEVPTIFVATDDCTVMPEFRQMRPNWNFVSECDVEENSKAAAQNGFALRDFKNWGDDAEDAHFTKFFTEIYAMTMSRVFIGVGYTNVSWWVYFLRPFRHSFILLDKPKGAPDSRMFDFW
mmetsp:Transcript_481/g.667  ORF Transcript_481/g.667 Transcript_481/m.667 type:complete len:468 (-) Transcript_481:73-1476(-)